jgi:hypothetical protein
MNINDGIAYDKSEMRLIIKSFAAMSDEAIDAAKKSGGALAEYLQKRIIDAASLTGNSVDNIIAEGSKVVKSSKIGEMSFGFASQKLSGGGTTQQLWGGYEFGSNKYKQFPNWSGKFGRGSRGWFIYPTLRSNQKYIIDQWEASFDKIVKVW